MTFKVIDKKTGKEPDTYKIALKEDWAKCLVYCDIEGFALTEDGVLVLMDECGNVAYCPDDRFEIAFEEEKPQGEWITIGEEQGALGIIYKIRKCSKCGLEHSLVIPDNFCPNCGVTMRKGGAEWKITRKY